MRVLRHLKKVFIAIGIVIPLFLINVANLNAQEAGGGDYLAIIARNTTDILQKVNDFPQYIDTMVKFTLNVKAPIDDKDPTATMQSSFDLLGKAFVQDSVSQNASQQQLTADMLNKPITDLTQPANRPAILTAMPNVNDLSYASMMGATPVMEGKNKGAFSPYNYVKYASGANIAHVMPRPDWNNKNSINPFQPRYSQYYNTIMAVESFNAYVLSNLWMENQTGNQTSTLQDTLITQASSSDWIANIGGEEIGKVLRQILIFQSQTYVLLTQLLQTQKQLLTATTMTNSLLILNNGTNENYMVSRAQGVTPSG